METRSPTGDRSALPSFPKRVLEVFVSPVRLMEALAARPVWAAALLAGAALVVLQVWLIPGEIWEASFRRIMMEQGQNPQDAGTGAQVMRISGMVFGAVAWALFAFILTGVITVLFAFVLGDEGRYVQYLSSLAHAWLIPAVVGLALVPLRIAQEDPQLTLSLGTFFFFLPEGYLLSVLSFLDLSQLWALLVVAQGAHAIDPRRSFASAAVVLLLLNLALAMLLAPFVPT